LVCGFKISFLLIKFSPAFNTLTRYAKVRGIRFNGADVVVSPGSVVTVQILGIVVVLLLQLTPVNDLRRLDGEFEPF
jgi:hypothetical protein